MLLQLTTHADAWLSKLGWLQVVLDLGRRPHARYLGGLGGEDLREAVVRSMQH